MKLNSVFLTGTLVQKSPLKKLESGDKFLQFTLKSDIEEKFSSGTRNRCSCEFEIFSYDRCATRMARKEVGEEVQIIGQLKQIKWTDSAGRQRSRCVVVAEHLFNEAVSI